MNLKFFIQSLISFLSILALTQAKKDYYEKIFGKDKKYDKSYTQKSHGNYNKEGFKEEFTKCVETKKNVTFEANVTNFGVSQWWAISDECKKGNSTVEMSKSDDGALVFSGVLNLGESRWAYAEINTFNPDATKIGNFSSFKLKVKGDGQQYMLKLSYSDDFQAPAWGQIFNTTENSSEVELLVNEFVPMNKGAVDNNLTISNVTQISIVLVKFEQKEHEGRQWEDKRSKLFGKKYDNEQYGRHEENGRFGKPDGHVKREKPQRGKDEQHGKPEENERFGRPDGHERGERPQRGEKPDHGSRGGPAGHERHGRKHEISHSEDYSYSEDYSGDYSYSEDYSGDYSYSEDYSDEYSYYEGYSDDYPDYSDYSDSEYYPEKDTRRGNQNFRGRNDGHERRGRGGRGGGRRNLEQEDEATQTREFKSRFEKGEQNQNRGRQQGKGERSRDFQKADKPRSMEKPEQGQNLFGRNDGHERRGKGQRQGAEENLFGRKDGHDQRGRGQRQGEEQNLYGRNDGHERRGEGQRQGGEENLFGRNDGHERGQRQGGEENLFGRNDGHERGQGRSRGTDGQRNRHGRSQMNVHDKDEMPGMNEFHDFQGEEKPEMNESQNFQKERKHGKKQGHQNREGGKGRNLDEEKRGKFHDMKGKFDGMKGKLSQYKEKQGSEYWSPIFKLYKGITNVHTGAFKLEIESITAE